MTEHDYVPRAEIEARLDELKEQRQDIESKAQTAFSAGDPHKISMANLEYNVFLLAPSIVCWLWGFWFLVSPAGFEDGRSWKTMADISSAEVWGSAMVTVASMHIGFSILNKFMNGTVAVIRNIITAGMMGFWSFIAVSRLESFPDSPVWMSSAFFAFALFLTLVREWSRD